MRTSRPIKTAEMSELLVSLFLALPAVLIARAYARSRPPSWRVSVALAFLLAFAAAVVVNATAYVVFHHTKDVEFFQALLVSSLLAAAAVPIGLSVWVSQSSIIAFSSVLTLVFSCAPVIVLLILYPPS